MTRVAMMSDISICEPGFDVSTRMAITDPVTYGSISKSRIVSSSNVFTSSTVSRAIPSLDVPWIVTLTFVSCVLDPVPESTMWPRTPFGTSAGILNNVYHFDGSIIHEHGMIACALYTQWWLVWRMRRSMTITMTINRVTTHTSIVVMIRTISFFIWCSCVCSRHPSIIG